MTRDIAINLANQALVRDAIQGFVFCKAQQEIKNDRHIWLVIFLLREQDGIVTTPDTIFVEVDSITQSAVIIKQP